MVGCWLLSFVGIGVETVLRTGALLPVLFPFVIVIGFGVLSDPFGRRRWRQENPDNRAKFHPLHAALLAVGVILLFLGATVFPSTPHRGICWTTCPEVPSFTGQ